MNNGDDCKSDGDLRKKLKKRWWIAVAFILVPVGLRPWWVAIITIAGLGILAWLMTRPLEPKDKQ